MQAPLSLTYLRETAGHFEDPQHAHSFARDGDAAISRHLLRDCALCHQRALPLSLSLTRRAEAAVCRCLRCGVLVHRACLSQAHLTRGHESALPLCTAAREAAGKPALAPAPRLFGNEQLPGSFTLSTLIEELARDSAAPVSVCVRAKAAPPAKSVTIAKRVAPFLAAGGVLGALALGPIGGVVAGLNVFVASVGVEAIAAGVGLTAATAAAATVTRTKKLRRAKRKLEQLRSGEWAREICWACKNAFPDEPSDEAFRKDAEFLRRFQAASADAETGVPNADEVFAFLFAIFSSPSEFLSQVNMQLCAAFRERHNARHGVRGAGSESASPLSSASKPLPPPPPPPSSSSSSSSSTLRDTLQDAKMYIAHIMGAAMQSFPSLASTDQAVVACAEAVERIVYDDIHRVVFREFVVAFADADAVFHDSLDRIRREQRDRPVSLLYAPPAAPGARPALHDDLQAAEQQLAAMVLSTCSPLRKLKLLCRAFRSICCFADQLHQTASNADILIPIVCSLLIASPRLLQDAKRTFVSEIAFISFFTNGGGKGAEGYVLTTFHAVIQVIAAVDLSNGPAKELELFGDVVDTEEDTEDDEFFDAVADS